MADLDKIMTALRNAHAAGDTAAAKRLAAMAKAAKPASNNRDPRDGMTPGERAKAAREGRLAPPSEGRLAMADAFNKVAEAKMNQTQVGPMGAFVGNLAPGLTFGFADEIAAGLASLAGEDYDKTLEGLRAQEAKVKADNPKSAMAGQVVGAVAVPVATAARGANLLRSSAQSALTGMGLAGLTGFGTGEGGFQERSKNALAAAPLGYALGGAAPIVGNALAQMGGGTVNALRGLFNRATGTASQKAADRAIARVIEKSGQSPDDVVNALRRAAADGQPEFRLMDATGQAGQRAASAVVRRGDDGAESLANFFRARQSDQVNRVSSMVEDAFDARTSAAKTAAAMNASRKAANRVNYAAAAEGAGPVNLSETIGTIDELLRRNPIVGEAAFARSEIGNRLASLRGKLANDKGARVDFRSVLEIKEDLGAVIGEIKSNRREVPAQLAEVFGKLDGALEEASDGYRLANDTARAARMNIKAIEEGAEMARPGARAQDTTGRFSAMTPEQQAAARVGYGDRTLAQIEANRAVTANKVAPFNSSKARQEAEAMAQDPALFARMVGRENDMWSTMNRAMGGSRTADNFIDDAMAIPESGPGRQAVIDLLRLNFGGAATNLAIAVGPALRGQSPATRKLIADALMSADPEVALRAAARSVSDEGVKRAIASALNKAGAVTVAN